MKAGDIVIGLPSASPEYSVTRGGTKWVITEIDTNEEGEVVEIKTAGIGDVAKSLARKLKQGFEIRPADYIRASWESHNTFWVKAVHFQVCDNIMNHRLLQPYLSNKEKKGLLFTVEGDGSLT